MVFVFFCHPVLSAKVYCSKCKGLVIDCMTLDWDPSELYSKCGCVCVYMCVYVGDFVGVCFFRFVLVMSVHFQVCE